MPTVPTFQPTDMGGPGVSPGGLPPVRVSSDAPIESFGGGGEKVQQAANQTTDVISALANEERDRANRLASISMSQKFAAAELDVQFNKETGVMNLRGEDAARAPDAAKDQWKAKTDPIAKSATNPILQATYKQLEAQHWDNLNQAVQRHMASEHMKYTVDTADAALKTEQLAASLSSDATRIGQSIGTQNQIIDNRDKVLGIPPDSPQSKAEKAQAASDTYVGVINNFLANHDSQGADGFYKAIKGNILPAQRLILEDKIEAEDTYRILQQVSNFADQHRLSNGMIDIEATHAFAKTLDTPVKQEYQIESHIRSMVYVDNAETREKIAAQDRAFADEVIKAQGQHLPYAEAIKIVDKYPGDDLMRAQRQAEVAKIYASPQDRFSSWIKTQDQDVLTAYEEAKDMVKAKYSASDTINIDGVQMKAQDSALNELQGKFIGQTADQIRDITKKQMEKVVAHPWSILGHQGPDILQPHVTAWQADIEDKQAISTAWSKLNKDYSPQAVSQARGWLATHIDPRDPKGGYYQQSPANADALLSGWVKHKNASKSPQ